MTWKNLGLSGGRKPRQLFVYVKSSEGSQMQCQCSCKRNVRLRRQSRGTLGQEVEGRLGKVVQSQVKFWRMGWALVKGVKRLCGAVNANRVGYSADLTRFDEKGEQSFHHPSHFINLWTSRNLFSNYHHFVDEVLTADGGLRWELLLEPAPDGCWGRAPSCLPSSLPARRSSYASRKWWHACSSAVSLARRRTKPNKKAGWLGIVQKLLLKTG